MRLAVAIIWFFGFPTVVGSFYHFLFTSSFEGQGEVFAIALLAITWVVVFLVFVAGFFAGKEEEVVRDEDDEIEGIHVVVIVKEESPGGSEQFFSGCTLRAVPTVQD